MKRWISVLLSLLMVLTVLPDAGAAASAGASPDSWEALKAIEARAVPANSLQSVAALAASYADHVEEMILAVQRAPDYVPGSLDRHGNFFFWETRDGRANGYSPSFRARVRAAGGGQPVETENLSAPRPSADPANTSDSRNVAVIIPYSGSYYFFPEDTIADGQQITESTGGTLSVYTAENTNIDTVAETIENAGILLINSHGQTDYEVGYDYISRANTSYLCIPTDAGITAEDQKVVTGPYGTYRHAYYAGNNGNEEYYCVDGTCIRNHMTKDAPHSMVWLGFCLGMVTDGLFVPLQEKGVEAMIGFSHAVTTNADHAYRAEFCKALLLGRTVGEAAEIMKETVGCPDPYQVAHDPAYPIAVSSQDPYPGRDHLSDGQLVQSTLELYPAYPIEITVEPAGAAAVTVERTRVTVTPETGYLFSDYEITQGDATAKRSGNVLDFRLYGPIAVTIHMEARTPSSVCFRTGPGQSCEQIDANENDVILLPAPTGELEADACVYHFLGWSREGLTDDSTQRPDLLVPGSRLQLSAGTTELWAVYGYFAAEDPAEAGQFRLVSEEPEDWAGDYVLTYQSTRALRSSPQVTGPAILSPAAVATDVSAGYFVDREWLNEVLDELVYSFVPCDDGSWLLKMKTSENYLAVPSSNAMLSTLTAPDARESRWRIQWTEGPAMITNRRFTSRILQFSTGSSGFCTLTSLRCPLTLYRLVPGEHRYTTQPHSGHTEPDPGPAPDPEPDPEPGFDDVDDPKAYYYGPVYWALDHRVTGGTGLILHSDQGWHYHNGCRKRKASGRV